MKKFCLLLFCLFMGMGAFAQQGEKSLGLNLLYGNDTNIGLSAKMRYSITDKWRVEPAFEYFFKHDYFSMWDLGANLHYVIPATETISVYPLAGLAYFRGTADLSELSEYFKDFFGLELENASGGKVGFNLGVGGDFRLKGCTLSLEAKFQLIDGGNQLVVGAGFAIPF